MKIIFTIFNIRIIILPRYYMIRLWRSGRIKPLSRNFFPAMNAKGSINASVSFFLSRRIVETWNNLITKKGKNGETRVNHNACLILSSLPFLPFLEKWLFRTTVSDNGADNGLTSINQVQPGVIGRECKKRSREYENVNQDGGPSSVGRKEPTRVGQLGKRHRNGCSK